VKKASAVSWAKPLAQDYVVIDRVPDPEGLTDAPSLIRTPGGRLLCAFPVSYRPEADASTKHLTGMQRHLKATRERIGAKSLKVFRSADDGNSWEECCEPLAFWAGKLFLHSDKAFYLGIAPDRKGIQISCSEDEGDSWLPPVKIFSGLFYCTSTGMAERNGTLYWSAGTPNTEGYFNTSGSRSMVFAGDLSGDLMDPASWRRSEDLTYPGTPNGLSRNLYDYKDHYLEPNVVNVRGNIRVILRPRIDHYATSNTAVVCDVEDDGKTLDYVFTQFYPLPGAQNHFHIIYDGVTRLFWMCSNLPTNTQDEEFAQELEQKGFLGKPGNERRFLILSYSVDALNWFQAGCIAMWPSPMQAFNYTTPLIDGEDLLIVSRTSKAGRNQHDNDLVTFHRLRDFRSLALDLRPHY
jgi:hypothetical protein